MVSRTNQEDDVAMWLPGESCSERVFFFILSELATAQPDWTSVIGNQSRLRTQLVFLFLAPSALLHQSRSAL